MPWATEYPSQRAGALTSDDSALLADLRSRRGGCGDWGVVRTAIFGFLTFGLAPALLWASAVRDQIQRDRGLYTRAADWFRFHSIHPEAGRLRTAAEGIRGRPFFLLLPIACCIGVVLFFLTSLDGTHAGLHAASWATHQYPAARRFRQLREQEFQVGPGDFDKRD